MAQAALIRYRALLIGGSAGSLEMVLRIIGAVPVTTRAAIIVVVHRKPSADSVLPGLLAAKTALPVKEVEDKDHLLPGVVYIAPAGYHLLLEDAASFSLDTSEKVHYSRPSIDVTFESAAAVFGPAAIGILLSGANADGAFGLKQIKEAGGIALVQDPATADVDYMPRQAILQGAATQVITAEDLPRYTSGLLLP